MSSIYKNEFSCKIWIFDSIGTNTKIKNFEHIEHDSNFKTEHRTDKTEHQTLISQSFWPFFTALSEKIVKKLILNS